MKRDLEKYIQEYNKKYCNGNSNKGSFYYSDINQLIISNKKHGGSIDLYNLIGGALESGFMVGYKAAKREKKKIKKK